MNRRDFIKVSAFTTAALLAAKRRAFGAGWQHTVQLTKFTETLPLPLSGLEVVFPIAPASANYDLPATDPMLTAAGGGAGSFDYYRINIEQFNWQVHAGLGDTPIWGFGDATNTARSILGGIIIARRGRPVRIRFENKLANFAVTEADPNFPGKQRFQPLRHVLDGSLGSVVDRTIPGCANLPDNRIAVHLHGGFIEWQSDGGPHHWFTPRRPDGTLGLHGAYIHPDAHPFAGADYLWTNHQSSRMMWYHDHAFGNTRINAYANVATGYMLVDEFERNLAADPAGLFGTTSHAAATPVLPNRPDNVFFLGIPLVFQDKSFYTDGAVSRMWYPNEYPWFDELTGLPATGRFPIWAGFSPTNLPIPSCIPEFFGDTSMVNGKAYPTVTIEPRVYRFRLLNANQARFLRLKLYQTTPDGMEIDKLKPAPNFVMIGTEGGFLPRAVMMTKPLILANAERADVLVDFRTYAGATFILYNDAPGPFPGGDPRVDYFTGMPDFTAMGGSPGPANSTVGPNTRTLMQIKVAAAINPANGTANPPINLTALNTRLAAWWNGTDPYAETPAVSQKLVPTGVGVDEFTLNEFRDGFGRLNQLIGGTTLVPGEFPNPDPAIGTEMTYGLPFVGHAALAAETPKKGTIRRWRFYNLSADTHPLHFHLINAQILYRAQFDPNAGPVPAAISTFKRGPEPIETGWKETVRMNPGEVIEFITRFDLPPGAPGRPHVPDAAPVYGLFDETKWTPDVDPATGLPPGYDPATGLPDPAAVVSPHTGGYNYVYHCHILEHEEHDMMRALIPFD